MNPLQLLLLVIAATAVAFGAYALTVTFIVASAAVKAGESFGLWNLKKDWQDEIGFHFFSRFGALGVVALFIFLAIFGVTVATLGLSCAAFTVYVLAVKGLTYSHQEQENN